MWDLEAKRRGVTLAKLLGGERTEVESGLAVGLYDSRDALWAAIDREMAAGAYKRVKVKICWSGSHLWRDPGVAASAGDRIAGVRR